MDIFTTKPIEEIDKLTFKNILNKKDIIVSLHALEAGIYSRDPGISREIAEVLKENIEKTDNIYNIQNTSPKYITKYCYY